MKLAVFGRSYILLRTVRALVDAGHSIAFLGTARASDTDGTTEADFERCAGEIGATYFYGKLQAAMSGVGGLPELAISMNWPSILGAKDVGLFRHGILNAHAGDLPRYRGNACPNWAILNGEARIGLCVHKMVPGAVDAGPIVLKRFFELDDTRDIGDVYRWLDQEIPQMFVEAANAIERETPSCRNSRPIHRSRYAVFLVGPKTAQSIGRPAATPFCGSFGPRRGHSMAPSRASKEIGSFASGKRRLTALDTRTTQCRGKSCRRTRLVSSLPVVRGASGSRRRRSTTVPMPYRPCRPRCATG